MNNTPASPTQHPDVIPVDDETVAIRWHLHEHPELGFHETTTTAYLTSLLKGHGIEILDLPLETGVVAQITGTRPGPTVGLRADIDALPVEEDSGVAAPSLNHGVMHACEHDLHMASLLGAAFWLSQHRDLIAGTVRLIFQPAEELGRGAVAVIKAGGVDGLDALIGTHNNPAYEPGTVVIGPEPMMAGCVRFRVDLHAQGSHGAMPHLGTGPIEALASMVLSLQTIVSRSASPFHPLVVSVTDVHGGDVWNVIPAEAGFQGTARYFYAEDAQLAARRFRQIVDSTAQAYGITADITWDDFQDPLVSDAELAGELASHVDRYAKLHAVEPTMIGEDFTEYGKYTRIAFAFIGSNGRPGYHNLHSPRFVGLDGELATGQNFYAHAALETLDFLRKQA